MKLGVLIPFRDRWPHLFQLVPHLTWYLSETPFDIILIEQANDKPFNRGLLLNIGFHLTRDRYDYFALHDVDQLPVDADYSYPKNPTHLGAYLSQWGYKLPFEAFFGAACLFTREHFQATNGFSNSYWGYGYEDTDLALRVHRSGLIAARRPGRFISLDHGRNVDTMKDNGELFKERANADFMQDGLSNLNYKVINEDLVQEGLTNAFPSPFKFERPVIRYQVDF